MDNRFIRLLKRIKHIIEDRRMLFISKEYCCFVPNVNLSFIHKQKHVLLSYSPCTFQFGFQKCEFKHSNGQEITEIINLLIKRGCCVDIIDCACRKPLPYLEGRVYDYVIGFGEPYKVAYQLNPSARMIFFMTENLPSYVREKFQKRCDYYYQRHGKRKTGIVRDAALFKDEYLDFTQDVISINSRHMLPCHQEFLIYPSGLLNKEYQWHTKDFQQSRYNFVWFGSAGAIHKGLDILIDVFAKIPRCHLYIYGLDSKEKFLMKDATNNVHDKGTISVFSDDYLKEVVDKCAFVILSSCSEGVSTGVITNMLHGLIPVVTEECNIPQGPYSILLENYKCEHIQRVIENLMDKSDLELEKMSKESFYFARKSFTLEAYRNRMEEILTEIIKEF